MDTVCYNGAFVVPGERGFAPERLLSTNYVYQRMHAFDRRILFPDAHLEILGRAVERVCGVPFVLPEPTLRQAVGALLDANRYPHGSSRITLRVFPHGLESDAEEPSWLLETAAPLYYPRYVLWHKRPLLDVFPCDCAWPGYPTSVSLLSAAFVSSSLRETQNKNVELDTKKQILAALNIKDVKDAEAEYNKYVKGDMLMNVDGTLTENTGAFATAYEKEAKENNRLHVFVAEVDGEKKYVFPVYGAGLWGAIWGYVALNSDKDTVYGVYFSHASETPGLGAEIASTHFQGEFPGKKTLENGEVVLGVVKNGKVEKPDYQVDGISGGTITSVGVDAMLKACLSSYKNFLTNNNEEE